MEAAYFYENKYKKDMDKLLDGDFFKRLGPINRDAVLLGTKRNEGFYLYIRSESEATFKEAQRLMEESKIPFIKLAGDEEKQIFEAIRKEEEEAASGMGAIFG